MKRILVLLYGLAALLDDLYTFYMVGVRRFLIELNPVNRVVEVNPWLYLVLQALKEPVCLLGLILASILFYNSFYMINKRAAVIGSRLIFLGGVFARWVPVVWNLWVLGRFLA